VTALDHLLEAFEDGLPEQGAHTPGKRGSTPSGSAKTGGRSIHVSLIVLRLVWRHKLLIAMAMLVAVVIGGIAYALIPVKYEASSLLFMSSGTGVDRSESESRETPERLLAVAQIALTNDVLARAIAQVGVSQLRSASEDMSFVTEAKAKFNDALKSILKPKIPPRLRKENEIQLNEALTAVRSALVVKPDAKASVLILQFRHADPHTAAKFVNELGVALVNKQHELWGLGIAANFFERQKGKFDAELTSSFNALSAFSVRTGVFSVDEQRSQILQRYTQLESELATAQAMVSQKTGERQAVTEQLKKLKPVTQSAFVSGIVDDFGAKDATRDIKTDADQRAVSTPPLLMIKVYQETIVDLFKDDAQLVGLNSRIAELRSEIHNIENELGDLSSKSGEFSLLRAAVTLAQYNVDTYGKRMAEEIANQDSAKFRMSTLKIVQAATPPVKPVSPSLLLTLAASLVFGVGLAGIGIAGAERKSVGGRIQSRVILHTR
jgi:uncharacterized protein involved in exopolysaccharide biosynthesis